MEREPLAALDRATAILACLVGGVILFIGADLLLGGRLSGTHRSPADDVEDALRQLTEQGS